MLSALAVLAAAVGWLPNADPTLISWGIPTVLGEIIATMVMFFKSQWSGQITVNLVFDGVDSFDIDFETSSCTYSVIDSRGKEVSTGTIAPILGHGGWQIVLPINVNPDNSISLSLVTQAGERWLIRPFLPMVHTQSAVKQG
jgi:hypothetical protein